MSTPGKTAVAMLAGQVLSMVGISSYPVLLPQLATQWQLTHTQSGLISSGFFLGYVGSVSFWSTLTDRRDARGVYLLGCAFGAVGLLMFGLLAQGFWGGLLAHILYGVGVAATYMPGLKILSERFEGRKQTRLVSFYTAFFGLGSALSLWMTQQLTALAGWQWAFMLCALGPALAGVLVAVLITGRASAHSVANSAAHSPAHSWGYSSGHSAARSPGHSSAQSSAHPSISGPGRRRVGLHDVFPLQAWRRVLRVPAARRYIAGYTVHCLELFGSRAWIVALLVFALGAGPVDDRVPSAASIAAAISLFSVAASILGNEAALRLGRLRWIRACMLASSILGVAMAGATALGWIWVVALALLYSLAVMADSATLTAGLVQAADPSERGAALGLYSFLGFGGGMIGPALFGLALDLGGGGHDPASWALAFAALGAGCLVVSWWMRGSDMQHALPQQSRDEAAGNAR